MDLVYATGVIGMSFIPLIIGIGVSVVGSYFGYRLFSRLTTSINEAEELKRGNVSIGIILMAVLISLGIVLHAGVAGLAPAFAYAIEAGPLTPNGLVSIGFALFQLFMSAMFAILAIFIAFRLFSRLSGDVDEFQEIKQGNVAVALQMAGISVLTALATEAGISAVVSMIY